MLIGNTQPDGLGAFVHQVLDTSGRNVNSPEGAVSEAWVPAFEGVDTTELATWEVPNGQKYWVLGLYLVYTSTDTAGSRVFTLEILDIDGVTVVWRMQLGGLTQGASIVRTYSMAPSFNTPSSATFSGSNFVVATLPTNFIIPSGYTLKVYDSAGIDTDDALVGYLWYQTQSMSF